jgi:hypothetical protein
MIQHVHLPTQTSHHQLLQVRYGLFWATKSPRSILGRRYLEIYYELDASIRGRDSLQLRSQPKISPARCIQARVDSPQRRKPTAVIMYDSLMLSGRRQL